MNRVVCGSGAVTHRPERTARGYRRFRCRDCGKGYDERSGALLNRSQYPSDLIALVALWRSRYRLTLRDLAEMFLQRGFVLSREAARFCRGYDKLRTHLRPSTRHCQRVLANRRRLLHLGRATAALAIL